MSDPKAIPVVVYAARSARATENQETAQQIAAVRAAVKREGGREIVSVYEEDGKSGWRGDRGPQLEAAMAHAVALADDHATVELWSWMSNRVGRGSGRKDEARSVLEVLTYLRRHGVTGRSVKDDEFMAKPMLWGFAAEQAEKYSADLSANVSRGKDAQWERGDWIGGPIPDGFMSNGAKGIAKDPIREGVIAYVWELAIAGRACASIARQLNAEGHRTKNGGAWTRRRVQDLLSNAVYAGFSVRWRGQDREQRRAGVHPAYVSADDFEAVARATAKRDRSADARTANAGRPSRRYLLATLTRCWKCGGKVYAVTSTYRRKDDTRQRLYMCGEVHRGTGLCDAPSRDATVVDAAFIDRLPRFIDAAEGWLAELGHDRTSEANARAALDAADAEARAIRERVARDEDRYDHEDDDERADALLGVLARNRRRLARADADVNAARAELAAVQETIDGDAATVALRSLTAALNGGETLATADFNRRLREHFAAVYIDADGVPVPVWKVAVPVTVADDLAARRDADVASIIAGRVAELGLDHEHNGEGFQKPYRIPLRVALLPLAA